MECGVEEEIPRSAIEIIDIIDEGIGAPEFECKECDGIMQSIESEGSSEIEYIKADKCELNDDDDWLF